jgi:two-component system, LytTR family, response regulator
MIRTIIIDDEKHVVDSIELLLNDYCKDVCIIGKCTSYEEGIRLLSTEKPDLLLLDIEMPFGTGFDLLEKFTDISFEVIFITAFSQYALKAIKYSALDYILKPVDIKELKAAIKKVMERKNRFQTKRNYETLFENLKSQVPTKLAIPISDGMEYLNINDIIRLEADGRYSTIYTKDKTSFFVTRNLGEFEELLSNHQFFRVHNSFLININYVKKISRIDGGIVEMTDASHIPISRSKKNDFLNRMKEISQ